MDTGDKDNESWESRIDISHVTDETLRHKIMGVLREHSAMWDGNLGTINATEYRIELPDGTKPISSMPYRQGPAMQTKVGLT